MARRAVQISTQMLVTKYGPSGVVIEMDLLIVAVCEDGTIWSKQGGGAWIRHEEIPD